MLTMVVVRLGALVDVYIPSRQQGSMCRRQLSVATIPLDLNCNLMAGQGKAKADGLTPAASLN
jgi:hypothetical protein